VFLHGGIVELAAIDVLAQKEAERWRSLLDGGGGPVLEMLSHALEDGPQQLIAGQHRLVQVHLPVHEPPRDQEVFDRVDAFRLDCHFRVGTALQRTHAHRLDEPLHADFALRHACVKRVAPQVVEPVHVELAGDELVEEGTLVGPIEDFDRLVQRAVESLVQVEKEHPAHPLVVEVGDELVLQRVRVRPVADVVQERRRECRGVFFRADGRALFRETLERVLHECHRPERMHEARVLGPRKDEVSYAELPDPPETLHFGRLNQVEDQVFRHRDKAVHRIREDLEMEAVVRVAQGTIIWLEVSSFQVPGSRRETSSVQREA